MKYLDGTGNLKQTFLRQLIDSAETEILISYTDISGEEVTQSYPKFELFENVFIKESLEQMDYEKQVIFATDEIMLEIKPVDMEWWMKPIHQPKLYALIGENIERPKKVKSVVQDKQIAVAEFEEATNTLINVESMTVKVTRQRPALNWLNTHIENYSVRKKYDKLRVCIDFDEASDNNEWFSVDELLEKGVASV